MKSILLATVAFCILLIAAAELSFSQINSVYLNVQKLSNEEANNKYIMKYLLNENSVLVLGSSEFVDAHPFTPDNYFKNSALKAYAIGEGWTETIVHMLRLAPIVNRLNDQKLVLNISMQWISNQDLSGKALLSKVNKDLLLQFLLNTDIPYTSRQRIADYVARKQIHFPTGRIYKILFDQILDNYHQGKGLEKLPSIARAKVTMLLWENNIRQYIEAIKLVTSRRLKNMFAKDCDCNPIFPLTAENALRYQTLASNNPYLIEVNYYDSWVRDNIETLRNLRYEPINSPEYMDIRDFVKITDKADVLFVLSPVHEFIFEDLGNQSILEDARIMTQKLQSDFKVYDRELLVFDQPQSPGTLKDVTNLGAVGWHKVNTRMSQKWLPEK